MSKPNDTGLGFLSYARDDGKRVLAIARDLRSAGAGLWIDQLDIEAGERWDRSVEEAIKGCTTLVVFLSRASVGSSNVMDEVSFALETGKRIIPVILEACDVPFRLRRLQRIDLQQGDEGFLRLADLLGSHRGFDENEAPAKAKLGRTVPQTPEHVSAGAVSGGYYVLLYGAHLARAASCAMLIMGAVLEFAKGERELTGYPVIYIGLAITLGASFIGIRLGKQAVAQDWVGLWSLVLGISIGLFTLLLI